MIVWQCLTSIDFCVAPFHWHLITRLSFGSVQKTFKHKTQIQNMKNTYLHACQKPSYMAVWYHLNKIGPKTVTLAVDSKVRWVFRHTENTSFPSIFDIHFDKRWYHYFKARGGGDA